MVLLVDMDLIGIDELILMARYWFYVVTVMIISSVWSGSLIGRFMVVVRVHLDIW